MLRPGRYAYTPGMRLTDLITSYQDLLPEPAQHYAEIVSLHQPDWRPVVESVDLEAAPSISLAGEVRSPGEYRTSGQMHLRDAIYQAGGVLPDAALDSAQLFRTQRDGSLQILNVNLAAA